MHFIVKEKNDFRKIFENEIIYISTTIKPHQLLIVTQHGRYLIYNSLNDIIKKSDTLIRCNKSTIVNVQKIKSIDKDNLKLYLHQTENLTIICSRRQFGKVLKLWKLL